MKQDILRRHAAALLCALPMCCALVCAGAAGCFTPRAVLYGAAAVCRPLDALAAANAVLTAQSIPTKPAVTTKTDEPTSSPSSGAELSPAASQPVPSANSAVPAQPPEGAGAIEEKTYAAQPSGRYYIPFGAASVYNCSATASSHLAQSMAAGLPFDVARTDAPQVLILHTHATECYEAADRTWWDPTSTCRTTDTALNMVAVGDAMAQVLNDAGIATLHDTALHDYPNYTGSYDSSRAAAQRYLEQYPSLRVILDVHRDAIQYEDGTRIKPVAVIDGQKTAQVMIICGADNGGNLPNSEENLRFAAAYAAQAQELYPGLMRPVLYDFRFYNQDLLSGCLLLEIGGHANTLPEAVRAGRCMATALASLLQESA